MTFSYIFLTHSYDFVLWTPRIFLCSTTWKSRKCLTKHFCKMKPRRQERNNHNNVRQTLRTTKQLSSLLWRVRSWLYKLNYVLVCTCEGTRTQWVRPQPALPTLNIDAALPENQSVLFRSKVKRSQVQTPCPVGYLFRQSKCCTVLAFHHVTMISWWKNATSKNRSGTRSRAGNGPR